MILLRFVHCWSSKLMVVDCNQVNEQRVLLKTNPNWNCHYENWPEKPMDSDKQPTDVNWKAIDRGQLKFLDQHCSRMHLKQRWASMNLLQCFLHRFVEIFLKLHDGLKLKTRIENKSNEQTPISYIDQFLHVFVFDI